MIQGLYAAANGMVSIEDRQSVFANNIANASTPGFKRQIPIQQGYYEAFFAETQHASRFNLERGPGGGPKLNETFSDFGDGILSTTGNPLDVALVGPAFAVVETPDGDRYTRDGKFAVNVDGDLVNSQGFRVLDTGGAPIRVNGPNVEIDSDGNVTADGQVAGTLQLVEFEDPHMLDREGFTLWAASPEAIQRSGPAEKTIVTSHALEMSNVQIPNEIGQMMMALRAYGANQQVIQAIDETVSRLIDQVGAPG
mgnify:CR=1 FL=1